MQLVRLPVSHARNKEGARYEVIICAPYEVRRSLSFSFHKTDFLDLHRYAFLATPLHTPPHFQF